MSDSTPPGDAGGSVRRPTGPLTPDAIDAVLADFRRWLEELANAPTNLPPVTHGELNVDLATVVATFTALRHEVNLQTKAARAQSEQLAAALDLLGRTDGRPGSDAVVRPLIEAVTDAYDTLTRTTIEVERLLAAGEKRPSLWKRLFPFLSRSRSVLSSPSSVLSPPPLRGTGQERGERGQEKEQKEQIQERLAAAATGLRMSELRVERLMREVGLEPIDCVGRPFDPETMEAVEAVPGGEHPSGTVVEEFSRGYLWDRRVIRYAQVRVAK